MPSYEKLDPTKEIRVQKIYMQLDTTFGELTKKLARCLNYRNANADKFPGYEPVNDYPITE